MNLPLNNCTACTQLNGIERDCTRVNGTERAARTERDYTLYHSRSVSPSQTLPLVKSLSRARLFAVLPVDFFVSSTHRSPHTWREGKPNRLKTKWQKRVDHVLNEHNRQSDRDVFASQTEVRLVR